MKRRRRFVMFACVPLVIASIANAWGAEGHKIVGAIAMTRLTPQARVAIRELLGDDDLSTAGVWADQIRGDPKYDWAKPLHYVNAPRGEATIVLARDCPTGECVVAAIPRFLAEAADRSKSMEDRKDALRFAIHFIGDLHQPLHAGYGDDLGGNKIPVIAFRDMKTNLHALWDTVLIHHKTQGEWKALAATLGGGVQRDEVITWQATLDPVEWANESRALMRRIYDQLPKDDRVGQEYYEANIATVERRLTAGGVRMAAALNKAFATASPATPSVAPTVKP